MSLWRRWRRLLEQSRIRLPKRGFVGMLAPGDRVQIGSELWRVTGRSCDAPSATFALEHTALPSRRVELRRACAGAGWELVEDVRATRLSNVEILCFAVQRESADLLARRLQGASSVARSCYRSRDEVE